MRTEELAGRLAAVRARIDAACVAAGRRPDEVTLVAVSKTWPASDVLALVTLGVADFGESYDQEARAKAAALTAAHVTPTWHFVGRLQRNKCASVARYADVVHSVDRPEVVTALAAGAQRHGRIVDALVQVSLDGDPDRGGCAVGAVPALADEIASLPSLRVRGVMAVAPLDRPVRASYATLRQVAGDLRRRYPEADIVSAGMTGDLEDAVAEGATHLRVGTALFGDRPRPVR